MLTTVASGNLFSFIFSYCSFPETVTAIWYENQGYYEQAKGTYESVINRAREMHNYAPAPPAVISEYKLWEQHWMKCAHELGQWDVLTEFGKSLGGANPFPGIIIVSNYILCMYIHNVCNTQLKLFFSV